MVVDKIVRTKWYTDKMVLDKMVRTEWYGQNGSNFWNRLYFKWIQYLLSTQRSQI